MFISILFLSYDYCPIPYHDVWYHILEYPYDVDDLDKMQKLKQVFKLLI